MMRLKHLKLGNLDPKKNELNSLSSYITVLRMLLKREPNFGVREQLGKKLKQALSDYESEKSRFLDEELSFGFNGGAAFKEKIRRSFGEMDAENVATYAGFSDRGLQMQATSFERALYEPAPVNASGEIAGIVKKAVAEALPAAVAAESDRIARIRQLTAELETLGGTIPEVAKKAVEAAEESEKKDPIWDAHSTASGAGDVDPFEVVLQND